MNDSHPVYCTLTPEEQHDRRSLVRACIVPQVLSVTSLAKGLRIDFRPDLGLRELVEEFIVLEQACCSFLSFTLSQPPDELSLQIDGPAEASQVLEMFRRTALGENHE